MLWQCCTHNSFRKQSKLVCLCWTAVNWDLQRWKPLAIKNLIIRGFSFFLSNHMNGNWDSDLVTWSPFPGPTMKSLMFGCRTRGGASTGKHLVPVGSDVLVLVETGSGVRPVWLRSSWKFITLVCCCSNCVTVCEKLSGIINRVLCLVKLVHEMQDVGNSETDACL